MPIRVTDRRSNSPARSCKDVKYPWKLVLGRWFILWCLNYFLLLLTVGSGLWRELEGVICLFGYWYWSVGGSHVLGIRDWQVGMASWKEPCSGDPWLTGWYGQLGGAIFWGSVIDRLVWPVGRSHILGIRDWQVGMASWEEPCSGDPWLTGWNGQLGRPMFWDSEINRLVTWYVM